MIHVFSIACLVVALLVLPVCYIVLCERMKEDRIQRPPFFTFFALFGAVGGWFLTFGLSPSGLAASCIVFLFTVAPLTLLFCGFQLWRLPDRSPYHRVALYGSFGYVGFLGLFMGASALFATTYQS